MIKRLSKKLLYYTLSTSYGQRVLDSFINYRIESKYQQFPKDEWLFASKNKHLDENCVILATGPSLAESDLSLIPEDWTVFGVNGIYLAQTRVDYYCYVSNWWHKNHISQMNQIKCTRRFIQSELKDEVGEHQSVETSWYTKILGDKFINKYLAESVNNPTGFSSDCSRYIHAGGTVVSICLQLAFHMGFKRVIITGLDHSYGVKSVDNKSSTSFQVDSTRDHSHFDPRYNSKGTVVPVDLKAMEKSYNLAKNIFEANGRSIVNASPTTYLDVFEKTPWSKDLFRENV